MTNRSADQGITLQSLGTIVVVLSVGHATRDSCSTPFLSKTSATSVSEKVKNVSFLPQCAF